MSSAPLETLGRTFDWRRERVEWPVNTEVGPGLHGVVAAETRVVWLDPSTGRLAYRGIPIETLAADADFEQVSFLLLTGSQPAQDPGGYADFQRALRASRNLPDDVRALVRDLDPQTHPTRLLRAGVSALGCHELKAEDDLAGERLWRELRIVGQVAALVSEIVWHRRGEPSREASDDCSLARGVLGPINGGPPDPKDVAVLDLLFTLYAAHGLDAPTFTSMVVASCQADPYTNVVAGLSALRGPRQGGAGELVLDQLLAREGPEEAAAWVRETLADGRTIAGFGHPAYRMPDPRVDTLRRAAARLALSRGRKDVYDIARAIEKAAAAELAAKDVYPNVNFYGALLFHLLGADPPLAPCLFAVARMAGLVALVRESLADIRLYRPLSRYVGKRKRTLPKEGRR